MLEHPVRVTVYPQEDSFDEMQLWTNSLSRRERPVIVRKHARKTGHYLKHHSLPLTKR